MAFDGKSQTGRRGRKRRQAARSPQTGRSRRVPSRAQSRTPAARPAMAGRRRQQESKNLQTRRAMATPSRSMPASSRTLQRSDPPTPPAFATRSRRRPPLAARPVLSRSAPPNRRLKSPHQRHLRVVPEPQRRAAQAVPMSVAAQPGTGARRIRRKPPSKVRKTVSPLLYALRLLIVGVGLGVIAGTVLSSIDPGLRYNAAQSEDGKAIAVEQAATPSRSKGLPLGREMTGLKTQIESLIAANEGLTAGVFVVDLDNQSYLDINARRRFSSASTIKLPILVALFEEIDAGNVSLNEQLTMTEELIATEAGEMQFLPIGTQFSVLDTAIEMIRISDNTATNLLIDRLGGSARLNQRFQTWGLQQTQLQNLLPDLGGTNTISPNDLVVLMGRINQGEIVSIRSRDRLLDILQMTQTNDLLPQGIGPGASIAHKTGNIGKVIGDVGLVDMPSGKRYIIMAMVERPHGDYRADELIRTISAETYQFLEATGSTSEQLVPTVPHSNIADQEPKRAPSIMTTDP